MKKNKLLFILLLLKVTNLFAEKLSSEEEYAKLPFFMEAEVEREKSLLDIRSYKLNFLPDLNLSSEATFAGSFEDGYSGLSITPSVNISQNLPFLMSLDFGLKSDMYKNSEEDFTYSFTPSASLSLPLFVTPLLASVYNDCFSREYLKRKKLIKLDYKLKLESSVFQYLSALGNYLYYRELEKLYDKKKLLLEEQSRDYEKLFTLGKINALDVSDKISELLKFYQEQCDVKGKIIAAEKELSVLGVKVEKIDEKFSDFLKSWSDFYEKRGLENYYSEEKELLLLEVDNYSVIKAYVNKIPSISGGFSFTSPYGDSDFPDLSLSTWKFNLAVNLPVSEKLGYEAFSALGKAQKLVNIEKEKIIRRKNVLSNERKNYLSLYQSYSRTMKNAAELEKKRLLSYENLNKLGRISDFDISMQKNNLDLSELFADYADFQILLAFASFY
ncbi:MAG: TolC family protein [Treponema sp.]|nr:TolC family protein [Treponema sp.]